MSAPDMHGSDRLDVPCTIMDQIQKKYIYKKENSGEEHT